MRYLTVSEAARLLSIHPVTVRRMVRRGELQAARVGRQYRVLLPEVVA